MNCHGDTAKMSVHLATVPRDWARGVPEWYVAGADPPRTPGRTAKLFALAALRSVSRSEQVIHEISGLGLGYAVGGQGLRHSLSFDLDSGSSFGQSLYNLAPSLT